MLSHVANLLMGLHLPVAMLVLLSAGCMSLRVETRRDAGVLDSLNASLGIDGLSERTMSTLRDEGLEAVWQNQPESAVDTLFKTSVETPTADRLFALAEMHHQRARTRRIKPDDALRHHYLCAGFAHHYLLNSSRTQQTADKRPTLAPADAFDPRFRLACDLYNHALSRCLVLLRGMKVTRPGDNIHMTSNTGDELDLRLEDHGLALPTYEIGTIHLASEFSVSGLSTQVVGYGLGVPLVVERRRDPKHVEKLYLKTLTIPATAYLNFNDDLATLGHCQSVVIELHDPRRTHGFLVRDHVVPLEKNLTTPLAYGLADSGLERLSLISFLRGDSLADGGQLLLLEPYSPGKIPIVLVHGLLSSPVTWTPVVNDLMADAEISAKYQFWVFVYPTSQPFVVTASQLRMELDRVRHRVDPGKTDRALERSVLIGHSMGGLVSRMAASSSGDDIWSALSDRKLADIPLDSETRQAVSQVCYFQPHPQVARVIFAATPHHGSNLANTSLGRVGRALASPPTKLMERGRAILKQAPGALSNDFASRLTSVDSLSPDSPFIRAMSKGVKPVVPFHTIAGILPANSRTIRAENLLLGCDNDFHGDGVVPYTSARLDGTESEVTVLADHMTVHHHPRALAEFRRILHLHLRQPSEILPVAGP